MLKWSSKYVLDIQNGKRDLISLLGSKMASGGSITAKLQAGFDLLSELPPLTRIATTKAIVLISRGSPGIDRWGLWDRGLG